MPAAISTDLRKRVIEHHLATGAGRIILARMFSLGSSTVYRWIKAYEATGTVQPVMRTSTKPFKIPDTRLPALRDLVAKKRDRTLKQLCDLWFEQTGVFVEVATMHRALIRAGLSFKKRHNELWSEHVSMSSKNESHSA